MTAARPRSRKGRHRPAPPRWTGWRAGCLRLALVVVAPLATVLILELVLTLVGVGWRADFFVPGAASGAVTPNQMFIWFYREERSTSPQPRLVTTDKPPGTLRVFVLGGSAAMGTPQPAFGFARILEVLLADAFPGQRVEVVNAALRGINSHIVVPIAAECVRLQADLLLVYAGNNEFTGRYGPETVWGRHPGLIPWLHAAKALRTSQVLRRLVWGVREGGAEAPREIEDFPSLRRAADDPRRERVYRNYRRNLTAICRAAREGGSEVLLATLPVNLRDWAPTASLHRADLSDDERDTWERHLHEGASREMQGQWAAALEQYDSARALDDHHAALHFRRARCLLALQRIDAARTAYRSARDWDALPFRADTRLNDSLRAVAAAPDAEGVHLVDVAAAWVSPELCPDGIPGRELFNDYVHFSFHGDYLMARTLLPAVIEILSRRLGRDTPPAVPRASEADCAQRLAYTPLEELGILQSVARLSASAPFDTRLDAAAHQALLAERIAALKDRLGPAGQAACLEAARRAIAAAPEDWVLRFSLAGHLYGRGRYAETAELMRPVVALHPEVVSFHILRGYSLAAIGAVDAARKEFRAAARLGTHPQAARQALEYGRTLRPRR